MMSINLQQQEAKVICQGLIYMSLAQVPTGRARRRFTATHRRSDL
jgi:hypothetical protein